MRFCVARTSCLTPHPSYILYPTPRTPHPAPSTGKFPALLLFATGSTLASETFIRFLDENASPTNVERVRQVRYNSACVRACVRAGARGRVVCVWACGRVGEWARRRVGARVWLVGCIIQTFPPHLRSLSNTHTLSLFPPSPPSPPPRRRFWTSRTRRMSAIARQSLLKRGTRRARGVVVVVVREGRRRRREATRGQTQGMVRGRGTRCSHPLPLLPSRPLSLRPLRPPPTHPSETLLLVCQ